MTRERCRGDAGSMMPMAVVMIAFLIVSFVSLVSASEAWAERRDTQAVASAAARSAAQPGPDEIVNGRVVIDPGAAEARAMSVLSAAGHSGSVSVSGDSIRVTSTGTVNYTFGPPGFPGSMTATATADVVNSVVGG